jgi:hypothetical protein
MRFALKGDNVEKKDTIKEVKYLEARGIGLSVNEIAMKGLLYPSGAGVAKKR